MFFLGYQKITYYLCIILCGPGHLPLYTMATANGSRVLNKIQFLVDQARFGRAEMPFQHKLLEPFSI